MEQVKSDRGDAIGSQWPIRARPWFARLVAVLLFFGVWKGFVLVTGVPALVLPAPSDVAAAYASHWDTMAPHVRYTTWELVWGWTIGTIVGIGVAILMAVSKRLRAALYPLVIGIRVVPIIVFVPLLLLAFGTSALTRILIAITLVFFPVTVATVEGLRATPERQLALARSVDASRLRTVVTIRIPNAISNVFAGLKIATPMALQGVILAEFLASSRGIGYKLIQSANLLQTPLLFAYVGVLAVMGLALFGFVSMAERLFSHGEVTSLTDGLNVGSIGDEATVSSLAVVLTVLSILVSWQILAVVAKHAALFVPRPAAAGMMLYESPWLFANSAYSTLSKVTVGWVLGVLVGIGLGTVIAFSDRVGNVLAPYLVGLRAIPDVAVIPLLLVWLRISFESAVILIILATFFPVAIGTAAGLRSLPSEHRSLLRSVDAPTRAVLAVRLRHALPSVFAGLKLAVVSGLAATVIAEWFVAERGLGVLVLQGMTNYVPSLTYAATVSLIILAGGVFLVVSGAQRAVSW